MRHHYLLTLGVIGVLLHACVRDDGGKDEEEKAPAPRTDDGGSPDGEDDTRDPPPADDGGDGGEPTPSDGLALRPETESIQQALVDRQCLSCHGAPTAANHHVDLTDVSRISARPSHHDGDTHAHQLVVPGCPDKSLFLTIMKEGKMPPPPAPKVAASDLDIVAEWITAMVPEGERDCSDPDEPGSTNPDPDEPGSDGGDDEPGD